MNFKDLSDEEIMKIFHKDSGFFHNFSYNESTYAIQNFRKNNFANYSIGINNFFVMFFDEYQLSINFSILENKIEIYLGKIDKNNMNSFFSVDLNNFLGYKYFNKLKKNNNDWCELKIEEVCELIRFLDRVKKIQVFS